MIPRAEDRVAGISNCRINTVSILQSMGSMHQQIHLPVATREETLDGGWGLGVRWVRSSVWVGFLK